jgi:hypothetical protein
VVTPLQSAKNTLDGSSVTATFSTANLSAGSKIIVHASGGGTGTPAITSVTATGGNTLTQIGAASQGNARIYIYACDASGAGGSSMVGTKPTITATWSGSAGLGLVIQEVPGLLAGNTTAMVDGTPGTLTGTAASTGSPTYSDTTAGQYKVASYGDFGNGVTVVKAAAWTADANNVNASTSANCFVQYISSSGGTDTDGFTSADTSGWAIVEVAFKLASGAPGPVAANPGPARKANRKFTRGNRSKPRVQVPPPVAAVSPDLTLNAPGVEATGVSPQPVVEVDLPQTGVTATGTAPQATPSLSVLAGIPTATGTAPAPVPAPSAVAGIPTATGQDTAVPSLTVFAGIPTATGTVVAPSILTGLTVNAGIPTATGSAPQPVVAEQVIAGAPTATGSSPAPVQSVRPTVGIPTATGAASQPFVSEQVLAGIPVATGVAPAPTIITGTTVNAGIPTATGTAPAAVPQIAATPNGVAASGVAPQPVTAPSALAGIPAAAGSAAAVANIRPLAGIPTATGGVTQPVVSISVFGIVASATGTSVQPGIVTGLVVNAPAVTATGSAAQPVAAASVFALVAAATGSAPPTSHGVQAGIPTATGAAPQPTAAPSVFALVATASAIARPGVPVSVLPHVTARSVSVVSQRMSGVSSVTETRQGRSLPPYDRREGASAVSSKKTGGTTVTEKNPATGGVS